MWNQGRYYLGEWHYHPNTSSLPSGIDNNQMIKLSRDKKLICNDQCQEAKYLRQGQSFGAERHSERATVSVTGIGHSDIRGLATDRAMVRRERYRL